MPTRSVYQFLNLDLRAGSQLHEQQATIAGGVKGFIAGMGVMGVGLPGAYMLNRRWPYYRQLPISLKALSVIMVVVPSFVISAEHAGQRYEREQWTGMGKEELDLEALRAQQHWKSMSASEKAQDWFARHEYGVIGTAWAMSMAGAFGYIMRDPHQSMTMKVCLASLMLYRCLHVFARLSKLVCGRRASLLVSSSPPAQCRMPDAYAAARRAYKSRAL